MVLGFSGTISINKNGPFEENTCFIPPYPSFAPSPQEVSSWYQENCMKAPVIPMAPKMPKPRRVGPKQKFYAKITGPMTPRQKSSTEMGLQRSSKVSGHFSEERFTPRLYEKTYDFPSRGYGNVELQAGFYNVLLESYACAEPLS